MEIKDYEDDGQNNNNNKSECIYGTKINNLNNNSTNIKEINLQSFADFTSIIQEEEEYHYLCPKCHKFPLIEFFKTRKSIQFTCSCYNNKKISIKDLFDKNNNNNYITKNSLPNSCLLSTIIKSNNNGFYVDEYSTLKFNDNFKYFCKTCLINISNKDEHNVAPHELIDLKSIKIDKEELNRIIPLINSNNDDNINENEENISINIIDEIHIEKLTDEVLKLFKRFIRIIINDFFHYPNLSHYYNIKNIIYFQDSNDYSKNNTNINNNISIKSNNSRNNVNINNNINIKSNEKPEITLKYIKKGAIIKLFNENFVKKNENKVDLEIEEKNTN